MMGKHKLAGIILVLLAVVLFCSTSGMASTIHVPYNVDGKGNPKYHDASISPFPGTYLSEAERDYLRFFLAFCKFSYSNFSEDIHHSIELDSFDLQDNIDPERLGPIYNDKVLLLNDLAEADSTADVINAVSEYYLGVKIDFSYNTAPTPGEVVAFLPMVPSIAYDFVKTYAWNTIHDPATLFTVAEKIWEKMGLGENTFGPLVAWPWDAATFLGTFTYMGLQSAIDEWYIGLGRACLNKAWDAADIGGLYRYENSEDLTSQMIVRLADEINQLKALSYQNTESENAQVLNTLRGMFAEDIANSGLVHKMNSALEAFRVNTASTAWIQGAITALEIGNLTDEDKSQLVLEIPSMWYMERNALHLRCDAQADLLRQYSKITLLSPVFFSESHTALEDATPVSPDEDWQLLYSQNVAWTQPSTVLTVGSGMQYSSINQALDAASPGDSIKVFPGDYPEQVVIAKDNITIFSSEKHGARLSGNGRCGFFVHADNVVIKDFDVSEKITGIVLSDCDNVKILGNKLTNNLFAGISLTLARNCRISGNLLQDNLRYGLYSIHSGGNRVDYNCFSANRGAPVYAGGDDTFSKNRWNDDDPFQSPHLIHTGASLDKRIYTHPDLSNFTTGDTAKISAQLKGLALYPKGEINKLELKFYFGDPQLGGQYLASALIQVSGNLGIATVTWDSSQYAGSQQIYAVLSTSGDPEIIQGVQPQYSPITINPPKNPINNTLFVSNIQVGPQQSISISDAITWVRGPATNGALCWVQVLHGGHLKIQDVDGSQGQVGGVPLLLGQIRVTEDIRGTGSLEADLTGNGPLIKLENISYASLGPFSYPELRVRVSGKGSIESQGFSMRGCALDSLELLNASFAAGSPAVVSDSTVHSAMIDHVANVQFSGGRFSGTSQGDTIQVSNSNKVDFTECTFSGYTVTAALSANNCADLAFHSCSFEGPATALSITESEEVVLEGSTLDGLDTGLNIPESRNVTVEGNTFENNKSALSASSISGTSTFPEVTLVLRANIFRQNTSVACQITQATHALVTDNTFEANATGLSLGEGTQDCLVYYNNFLDNTLQAWDQGIGNGWYKDLEGGGYGGNYWSTNDPYQAPYTYPSESNPEITDQGPFTSQQHGNDWVTADTTPPQISGLSVSELEPFSCLITWNTDEYATARIEINGEAYPHISQVFAQEHRLRLKNLDDQSHYEVTVFSRDLRGNETQGATLAFDTPDGTPPRVTSFSASDYYHRGIRFSWQTDELSRGKIAIYRSSGSMMQAPRLGWCEGQPVPVLVLYDNRRVSVQVKLAESSKPKILLCWDVMPRPDGTYGNTLIVSKTGKNPVATILKPDSTPLDIWEAEFLPNFTSGAYSRTGLGLASHSPWYGQTTTVEPEVPCSFVQVEGNNFCFNLLQASDSGSDQALWNNNFWEPAENGQELDQRPASTYFERAGDYWPAVVGPLNMPVPLSWLNGSAELKVPGRRLDKLAKGSAFLVEVNSSKKGDERLLLEYPLQFQVLPSGQKGESELELEPSTDLVISPGAYYLKVYDQRGIRAASSLPVLLGYQKADVDANCTVSIKDAVLSLQNLIDPYTVLISQPDLRECPLIYRNLDQDGDGYIDAKDYLPVIDANGDGAIGIAEAIVALQEVAGLRKQGFVYSSQTLSGIWWVTNKVYNQEFFLDTLKSDGAGNFMSNTTFQSSQYSVTPDGDMKMTLNAPNPSFSGLYYGRLLTPKQAFLYPEDLSGELILRKIEPCICYGRWTGEVNPSGEAAQSVTLEVDHHGQITFFSGPGELVSGSMYATYVPWQGSAYSAVIYLVLESQSIIVNGNMTPEGTFSGEFYEVPGYGEAQGTVSLNKFH